MSTIAVCVFTDFNPDSFSLEIEREVLYLYLNNTYIAAESYALVHNGKNFGVVKIILNLDTTELDLNTVAKVTKPLLAPVDFSAESITLAMDTIKTIQQKGQASRLLLQARKYYKYLQSPSPQSPSPSPDYEI